MSGLGGWTGVVDDIGLRLTRATGDAADHLSRTQHRFADRLEESARTLTAADRLEYRNHPLDPRPTWSTTGLRRSFSRPGARGATPPSGRFPAYPRDETELYVASRRLDVDWELTEALGGGLKGVYIARDGDNILYIYKPIKYENFGARAWLPHVDGQLAIREVAASRVFGLMKSSLVPPTGLVNGPFGPGMAKLYVPLKERKDSTLFENEQQAEAAIGDFLIGSGDGHAGNYGPLHDGNTEHSLDDRLVLFDHGASFPETNDFLRGGGEFQFRSDFIREWAGGSFSDDLVARVNAITPERMGSALEDAGLSDDAIDRSLQRLDYFHRRHTIHH